MNEVACDATTDQPLLLTRSHVGTCMDHVTVVSTPSTCLGILDYVPRLSCVHGAGQCWRMALAFFVHVLTSEVVLQPVARV